LWGGRGGRKGEGLLKDRDGRVELESSLDFILRLPGPRLGTRLGPFGDPIGDPIGDPTGDPIGVPLGGDPGAKCGEPGLEGSLGLE